MPEPKIYPKNRAERTVKTKEERRLYQKEYRMRNKDRIREWGKRYLRKYNLDNPHRYLYAQLKNRAKRSEIPFNLDLEDIVVPTHCPILGLKLIKNVGNKNHFHSSPSVDRKIPELGYVKGNIQVISMKANVMKNNATLEELERFANWILKDFLPSLKT